MEEYIEKLISQIRCKKARPYVADEIRGHMEDQIADNEKLGMSREEAEKNAVLDMGDPVAVGVSMDRIHKPQISVKLLVIIGIFSLLGLAIQYSIFSKIDTASQEFGSYRASVIGYTGAVIAGLVLMFAIYFVDYTVIAKYSKIIGLCIMIAGLKIWADFTGGIVNGQYRTISIGSIHLSVIALMMLYVPIYGAILYKYRGGRWAAFFKAVAWMLVPVWITFRQPSIVAAGIMMVSMLVLLTVAVHRGFFEIPVKRTIAGLWTAFLLLPVVMLGIMYFFHMMASYQEERLRAFFSASGDSFYLTAVMRQMCQDIPWFGNSGKDVIGQLPNFNSDYIFAYILNSYGSICAILVIADLALLVMMIFHLSLKQKNELGMMMGFGCGMIFLLNIVINILCSVGAFPPAASFLPFFSLGTGNILLCYALAGIVMSVYRYKDIYPSDVSEKVRMKKSVD